MSPAELDTSFTHARSTDETVDVNPQGGADAAVNAACERVSQLLDEDAKEAERKTLIAPRVESTYVAEAFPLTGEGDGDSRGEGCIEDERDCSIVNAAVCCVVSFARVSRPDMGFDSL